jgi:shikimate kinase
MGHFVGRFSFPVLENSDIAVKCPGLINFAFHKILNSHQTVRVFLIGYMGSGKSTFGPHLAKALKLVYYDLDSIIEANAWMSIKDIFKKLGQDHFRELEHKALTEYIKTHDNFVLATGGGTPCFFDNLDRMKETGITVYLDVPTDELARRLVETKSRRPLLKGIQDHKLEGFIKEQLSKRMEFYQQADLMVDGMAPKALDVARLVQEHYQKLS